MPVVGIVLDEVADIDLPKHRIPRRLVDLGQPIPGVVLVVVVAVELEVAGRIGARFSVVRISSN